jgi:Straboviridae homing endonuclease
MNHLLQYNKIIQKAKSENRIRLNKNDPNYVYYDSHHIIPACLNGSDESYNRQLLTDKEHYVCHKLLTYIYKENRKLACAFHLMTFGKNENNIKSSRDYVYARELIRVTPVSKETKEKIGIASSKTHKGRVHSSQWNEKVSKSLSGKIQSEETRIKRSKSLTGIKRSIKTRNKMSDSHIGIFPSVESCIKNSESNKNTARYTCEYCGKITNNGNYTRWHGKNCKFNR